MNDRTITQDMLADFGHYLITEEKSSATIDKYMRDVRSFLSFADGKDVTKELVLSYKCHLLESGYAHSSINSMLASINSFLNYFRMGECKVKNLVIQQKVYCPEEKELTKEEYYRLLSATDGNERIKIIMQSICSTGIRVSELKFFTVEGVKKGEITVRLKGKIRTILLPTKLRMLLLGYARKIKISSGCIFRTKNGKPLNRTYIWAMMKSLCAKAEVSPAKVFPHNLRKLFARTFYTRDRDIALLADILGHSSINTTRIYIMSTGTEHRLKMEKLGLVV